MKDRLENKWNGFTRIGEQGLDCFNNLTIKEI